MENDSIEFLRRNALNAIQSALGASVSLELAGHAGKQSAFRATTHEKSFFVRVFNSDVFDQLEQENRILVSASKARVSCVPPSQIFKDQNGLLVAFRPWIKGSISNEISGETARDTGVQLAQLHTGLLRGEDRLRLPNWEYGLFQDVRHPKWSLFRLAAVKSDRPLIQRFLDDAKNAVADILLKYPTLSERSCVVHGDIHSENILLLKEGMLFLDWEFSGLGSDLLDLSLANYHFVFSRDSGEIDVLDNALLEGYSSMCKNRFSNEEIAASTFIAGLGFFVHDLMGFVRSMLGELDRDPIIRSTVFLPNRLPKFERFLSNSDLSHLTVAFRCYSQKLRPELLYLAKKTGIFEKMDAALEEEANTHP